MVQLIDHTPLGKILLRQGNYVKFLYSLSCINSHRNYKKKKNNLRIVFRLLREFAGASEGSCMSQTLMVMIRLMTKRGETKVMYHSTDKGDKINVFFRPCTIIVDDL